MMRRGAWWVRVHAVGALVVPFVLITAYSARVGETAFASDRYGTLAFCLDIIAGLACAMRVLGRSASWKTRVMATLFYVPPITVALFVYLFMHVCSAYQRCL